MKELETAEISLYRRTLVRWCYRGNLDGLLVQTMFMLVLRKNLNGLLVGFRLGTYYNNLHIKAYHRADATRIAKGLFE